jgi:hypothetical protein
MASTALGRALRAHPVTALIVFVAVALVALWAALIPQPHYEATSVVSIQPASANVSTQSVEYLIPSIEQRLASVAYRDRVHADLPSSYSDATWLVSTANTPGSGVLRIVISSARRDVVVGVSNAYADRLSKERLSTVPIEVMPINPATSASAQSSRKTVLVSGFGLALILAALAALMRSSLSLTQEIDFSDDEIDDSAATSPFIGDRRRSSLPGTRHG